MSEGWFLYIEPFAGASGDMLLGAMLGLGVPLEVIEASLQPLGLEGWSVGHQQVSRAGLAAHRAVVEVAPEHHHRGLSQLRTLLDPLPDNVRRRSLAVFTRLAEAEARVHGMDIEQVHFHEVGAADALIDVVGVVSALEHLGVQDIYCGAFPIGEGTVTCEHGQMPNPAPATMELLAGWPMRDIACDKELVTPTGAALLTALGTPGRPPGTFTLECGALGAGARELNFPNVLRASLGWCSPSISAATAPGDGGWESLNTLECHLDDITGEILGYTMETLFEAGALEVSFEPLTMKKGRPGHRLWVLCRPDLCDNLAALVLNETTTLGVRRQSLQRLTLPRESVTVETFYGPLRMKVATDSQGNLRASPEYEDARSLAREHGVALRRVLEAAHLAYQRAGEVGRQG